MQSPPEATCLRLEEVATLASLQRLRPAWQALWQEVPSATPFQSPGWLIPWWQHIGEGELMTLTIWREPDERLVGLVPLYIYPEVSGRRLVFLLGMATTDYLDALAAPGHADAVMSLAFRHLAAQGSRWEVCEWPQLRPESALLVAAVPQGWREEMGESEACPLLALPPTVDGLREAIPAKTRQNLRTARRRAEQAGTLRWERAGPRDAEEIFEAQILLHQARWGERGESGVLDTDAVRAAHRAAVPDLLRSDVLRLHALRLDGRIIATLYGLADRPGAAARRVYFYLGGFDPGAAALSPGALLLGHAIEEAVREGASAFDFLRGGEAYKYRWGARDAPTYRRRLVHASAVLQGA